MTRQCDSVQQKWHGSGDFYGYMRVGSRDANGSKNLCDVKFQVEGCLSLGCSWLESKHKVKRFLSFATKLLSVHQPSLSEFHLRAALSIKGQGNPLKSKAVGTNVEGKLQKQWDLGGHRIYMCLSETIWKKLGLAIPIWGEISHLSHDNLHSYILLLQTQVLTLQSTFFSHRNVRVHIDIRTKTFLDTLNDCTYSKSNTLIFIGPRCPWGPIYGFASLKLSMYLCMYVNLLQT